MNYAPYIIIAVCLAAFAAILWSALHAKTERKTYTAAVMFDNQNRLALVRKAKPNWQRGKLNLIGGKIEEGETPFQCNRREFFEETGRDTVLTDWSPFCTISSDNFADNGGEKFCVHFFVYKYRDVHLDCLKGSSEEPIEIIDLCDVYPGRGDMLPNVPWLIGMAFQHLSQNVRATVTQ